VSGYVCSHRSRQSTAVAYTRQQYCIMGTSSSRPGPVLMPAMTMTTAGDAGYDNDYSRVMLLPIMSSQPFDASPGWGGEYTWLEALRHTISISERTRYVIFGYDYATITSPMVVTTTYFTYSATPPRWHSGSRIIAALCSHPCHFGDCAIA
jgi:hypothetical protein